MSVEQKPDFIRIWWPEQALTHEWLAVWVAVAAVVVAGWTIRSTRNAISNQTKTSRMEKMADAVLSFATRYESVRAGLIEARARGIDDQFSEEEKKTRRENLERTFWSIQFEQWEFYEMGLIPHRIMARWVRARAYEFVETRPGKILVEPSTLRSWVRARSTYRHVPSFQQFMDRIAQAAFPAFNPHADAEGESEEFLAVDAEAERRIDAAVKDIRIASERRRLEFLGDL